MLFLLLHIRFKRVRALMSILLMLYAALIVLHVSIWIEIIL